MHVSRCEGFLGQVRDPVTELVMTHCDEATPLTIEVVANRKVGIAAVTVMGGFWERSIPTSGELNGTGYKGMARCPLPAIWPRDPRYSPLL